MTATIVFTEDELEQQRLDHINALGITLQELDRAADDVALRLRDLRARRHAAIELDNQPAPRLNVLSYNLDVPGEQRDGLRTDLGLSTAVQEVLAGAYREPIRDLIAGTHAAEALLVSYGARIEDDRARVERDLAAARG